MIISINFLCQLHFILSETTIQGGGTLEIELQDSEVKLKDCCNPKNQLEFTFEVDQVSHSDLNFVKIIGKGMFGNNNAMLSG